MPVIMPAIGNTVFTIAWLLAPWNLSHLQLEKVPRDLGKGSFRGSQSKEEKVSSNY